MKEPTDQERLIELLTRFGVGFKVDEERVVCTQGEPKIEGYIMFFTAFDFDENGNFLEMGAYE